MDYQGRSPLKDVARSVVIGAAMVPAAMLSSCSRNHGTQPNNATMTPNAIVPPDAGALAPPVVLAPPPDVVRPRAPEGTGNAMPTRGFAGGSRPRG